MGITYLFLAMKWNILAVIGIGLFMTTVGSPVAEAEDLDLPVFPKDYADEFVMGENPFIEVMAAYNNRNYAKSLEELEILLPDLPPGGPSSETAAFLSGDLHFKLGAGGDKPHLRQSIVAFQRAIQSFPQSDNAVRGFLRLGLVNTRLKLYPEAMASYHRILSYHPKSVYAGLAQIEIATLLQIQGKLADAEAAYKKAATYKLSPSQSNALLMGQGDVRYRMQAFEDAYKSYSQALKNRSTQREGARLWGGAAQSLFQYGDASYQTRHYPEAREAFLLFFNLYGSDPLAPVAFTLAGEALRHEGKEKDAQKVYNLVKTVDKNSPGAQMARLLTMVGEMMVDECHAVSPKGAATKKPQAPVHCLTEGEEETARQEKSLSEIANQARTVIKNQIKGQSPSFMMSEILLEAANIHRRRGAYEPALEIQSKLLNLLPKETTPFQNKLISAMGETISSAVQEAAILQDHLKVVKLFYTYPAAFTPKMLTGEIGMVVANSLTKIGLLPTAIELYEPVSVSVANPFAQEALIQLARVLIRQGDYLRAKDKLKQFLSRYPKSARVPEVRATLGETFEQLGEKETAILEYQSWLKQYPRHPYKRSVAMRLAKHYQNKGEFKKEVDLYRQLMRESPQETSLLAMNTAEAYYRLKDYRKAIEFYEGALKSGATGSEADWAQLQLANSFKALGRRDEGKVVYTRLEQQTGSVLMKHLASEKIRERE